MLLEDGQSVAAFFELQPIGTEGRETAWLWQARDALENALQDSFDELDENPWVVQLYAQDEADWEHYLRTLGAYLHPRAQGSAFSEFYLRSFGHHLRAIAKPGGLFEDTTVTRLPWRGQTRRVRMVVYRRTPDAASARRGQSPEQALATICDRLVGGLANAGALARRTSTTGCCAGSTRIPARWAARPKTGNASTRSPATRRNRKKVRSSWPAATSRNACSSASRARMSLAACGSSTACRTGSSSWTACARRPRPDT
jgi:hypothetical protein